MKARKVYEAIEFERGRDPKETMDIGNKGYKILKKLDSIAKKFGLKKSSLEGLNKEVAIAKWDLPRLRGFEGGNIIFFKTSYPQPGGETYRIRVEGQLGKEIRPWTDMDTVDKWKKVIGILYESMEFERGNDPKEALGIGSKFVKLSNRTGMDFAELRFIRDRLIQFYDLENDKWDFRGNLLYANSHPESYNIERDSSFHQDINWAIDNLDDAWELVNLDDREIYIDESIDFERGKSDKDIKRSLRKSKFIPGEIVIRERFFGPREIGLEAWIYIQSQGDIHLLWKLGGFGKKRPSGKEIFIAELGPSLPLLSTSDIEQFKPIQWYELNFLKERLDSSGIQKNLNKFKETYEIEPYQL